MHTCNTKCGSPQTVTIPIAAAATTAPATNVASLVLNTNCNKNTCYKIDFQTTLSSTGVGATGITFQLYKQCGNMTLPVPVGFSRTVSLTADTSTVVSFSIPENDVSCCQPGCCVTYTLVATFAGITAAAAGSIVFTNSLLCATATGNCGCGCN